MPIDRKLLENLHQKYNTGKVVSDDQFKEIDAIYGDDNRRLVSNFYKKYAEGKELTDEGFGKIEEIYGLKKKESTPSRSSIGESQLQETDSEPIYHQEDRNFFRSVEDTAIEGVSSGMMSLFSGISGAIGATADLFIDKEPDKDKDFPFLSNEWISSKLQKSGEAEKPNFGTNQWVRDKFMTAAQNMSSAASETSSAAKESIGVKGDLSKSSIDHLLEGNFADSGKSLVVDVIAQIPNLALIAGTGGGGLAAVGASSAGANLNEQYQEDGDISALDYSQGVATGIVEVVSEKLFDMDIKGIKAVAGKLSDVMGPSGKALKDKIAKEGLGEVKDGLIRSIGDVFKETAKGAGQEIIEENIVTATDFLIRAVDEDILNEAGYTQLLKDMGQATLVAGAMGGGVSSVAAQAAKTPLTKEEKRQVGKYKELLSDDSISEDTRNIVKEKIGAIKKGVDDVTSESYKEISILPKEAQLDVLNNKRKIDLLEADKEKASDLEVKDAIDERIVELNSEIKETIEGKNKVVGELVETDPEIESVDEVLVENENIEVSEPERDLSSLTPEQEVSESERMMEDQENALRESKKDNGLVNNLIKKGFERQINVIKALGNSREGKFAKTMMTVVAGARSSADAQFKAKENEIYSGMSLEDEKLLDQILFHKRVIQIDKNKGIGNVKHPNQYNKDRSENFLEGIKSKVGEEKFNDISKRSEQFFTAQKEILGKLYEGGLITKESFEALEGDDYIKRVFLDHMNLGQDAHDRSLADYGLKKEQVKALGEGSTGLLLMDSKILLNAAYRSAEQRIFQSKANEALSKVIDVDSSIGKRMTPKLTKNKKGEITNRTTGTPKKGNTKLTYFKDGVEQAVEIKEDLAKEWLDAEKRSTELDLALRRVMGTAVLKTMATGTNATFAIGNVPADYLNVILFTDTFDKTNVFNAAQLLARSFASKSKDLAVLNATGKGSLKFKSLVDDFTKYGGKMDFLTTYGKPEDLISRDKRSGIRNKVGKVASKTVDVLAFAGETSEMAMRLAVFERVRNDLIKEDGGTVTKSRAEEINYEAVAKARKTMDFSKGGTWSKKLDNISPYLNAAAQGTRVAASYIYKNPVKFAKKLSSIGAATAALMIYNMSVGDDEDWDNLPDYIKNNYFIIFNPEKHENEKGEMVRGYRLIKKTPAAVPFLNLFEMGTRLAFNQMTGRNFGKKESVVARQWDAINDSLPIPIDPRQLPNKLPPVPKAVLSYFSNYDFYRNQNIVSDRERELLPQVQGIGDKNVATFYKKIGEASASISPKIALSPKKLQAATEMIITNPRTNIAVAGGYAILDAMVSKFSNIPSNWTTKDDSKIIPNIFGGAKSRVYREINPSYSNFHNEALENIRKELKTKNFLNRTNISNMVESNMEMSEIRKEISGMDVSSSEKSTLYKYAKRLDGDNALKLELPNYYKLMPVKYERVSPEGKAKILAVNVGLFDTNSEEFRDVYVEMKKMKIPVSKRFISEYQKLFLESGL